MAGTQQPGFSWRLSSWVILTSSPGSFTDLSEETILLFKPTSSTGPGPSPSPLNSVSYSTSSTHHRGQLTATSCLGLLHPVPQVHCVLFLPSRLLRRPFYQNSVVTGQGVSIFLAPVTLTSLPTPDPSPQSKVTFILLVVVPVGIASRSRVLYESAIAAVMLMTNDP